VTARQVVYCLLLLREVNYLILTIRYELMQLELVIFRLIYPGLKYRLSTYPFTRCLSQITFFCDAEKKHAVIDIHIYIMYRFIS